MCFFILYSRSCFFCYFVCFLTRGYSIARYAYNRFTVNLKSGGHIKLDRYLVSLVDSNHFGMLYVLALEDGREDHKCFQLTRTVECHCGNHSVLCESVLMGSHYHSTAIALALHSGSDPGLLICILLAVNRNCGNTGLEVEEKSLDGNGHIIYGLVALFTELVALFTAIAVNSKADSVKEFVSLSVDRNRGEILYVIVQIGRASCRERVLR